MLCACYFTVDNAMWSRDHYRTSRKHTKAQVERKLAGLSAAVQSISDSCKETCLHTQASQLNKGGRKHDVLPESDSPGGTRDRNRCRKPSHLTEHTLQNGYD